MISQIRDDIMGMPITVAIVDASATKENIEDIFNYFKSVDNRFSTYKKDSEISRFNRKEIQKKDLSKDMQLIFTLSEETKKETNNYFDIRKKDGTVDPSGIVKGWAIYEATKLLGRKGYKNFYIEAGGDIATSGENEKGQVWRVGIRSPFNQKEIIKIVEIQNKGIATSGIYMRGQHVYNPLHPNSQLKNIVSITVIGKNIYDADRFATAVFAMQEKGILFLEKQKDLEGYMINKEGIATYTSGFEKYVTNN